MGQRRSRGWWAISVVGAAIAGCGGGGGGGSADSATTAAASTGATAASAATGATAAAAPVVAASATTTATTVAAAPVVATPVVAVPVTAAPAPATPVTVQTSTAMSARDAVRLADQATFGPTETSVAAIQQQGAAAWVSAQIKASGSHYTSGGGGDIHQNASTTGFCDLPANKSDNCWRDWYSTIPMVWDFYRNATTGSDQLRQRVAFALGQITVVSSIEVSGTYGFRNYHNALLDNAFGNYRQVLKKVALSPVMGDFLNSANNDKAAPNENFPREMLQLFSLGTCLLNADGTQQGGSCKPTYDNATVRAYAYALTGWTYPAGGTTSYGCWPSGANCRYYGGDMVPLEKLHDTTARTLLSGVTVAANSTASVALETVLDSLMSHPNMAPFISRQLIQKLITSNPSASQVARASAAFTSGKFMSGGASYGTGQRGDLAATVAAILLDPEARSDTPSASTGKLREPALYFTGVLRGLAGHTDGDALGYWWGSTMQELVFNAPSVFNFYPPDFPLAGSTALQAPEFGIHNGNAALNRLNYLTYLLQWNGTKPAANVPNAVGTGVDVSGFATDAADAGHLLDRIALMATGRVLPATPRAAAITAVESYTAQNDKTNWQADRAKTAAYLVYASPQYQVAH